MGKRTGNKGLMLGGMAALLMTSGVLASDDDWLADARKTAMTFGKALKGEVVKSMKASGPVPTITMCNHRAPQIAHEVAGASNGWDVGRTSLKIRNPNNAPDDWERDVLEAFEARKAAGEAVKQLEFAEIVDMDGRRVYRYMKAIGTEKACLNCHAATVKPEVEARIGELYPGDQARGFKEGDIRGAFSLKKSL